MNHVMVDIETLGVRPTSIFLSLAAVQFDLETGKIGQTFNTGISLSSAQRAGRSFDASTLEWWMRQDDVARKAMFIGGKPLQVVLEEFSSWLSGLGENLKLWGNSASFDLGIIGNAYDYFGISRPWAYRDEKCYRTIVSMFPDIKPPSNNLLAHHPLEDCKWQIERLCKVWKIINLEPVAKERFMEAVKLLYEVQINSSYAVSNVKKKIDKFFGTPNTYKGYQFEKPESSGHSFTEGMEYPETKVSKGKDEENE